MLNNTNRLKDLKIHASDGEIGSIEDFYFDDHTWAIRYLIVNTGNWLNRKLVLISPIFLSMPDWEHQTLRISLTKKQIENSPEIDTHKPVSRQHEAEYMDYYNSSYYWSGDSMWGSGMYPMSLYPAAPLAPRAAGDQHEWADSHLRSTSVVTDYHIEASDGDIGHVTDFIVDENNWGIRYMAVKTRNWLPGKTVLISPEWIDGVSWPDSKVTVGLSREALQTAPEYVESESITRAYENTLHDHYGRRPYWLGESLHVHV
jgi:hypothetical protein